MLVGVIPTASRRETGGKGEDHGLIQKRKHFWPMGRARATGGTRIYTSNLPIFFMVLGMCFTECFTRRLTVGVATAYRWGGRRLTVGYPDGPSPDIKKPRQQGVLSGLWGQPVGDMWVYPGGLTIPLYCSDYHPSRVWRNLFFC